MVVAERLLTDSCSVWRLQPLNDPYLFVPCKNELRIHFSVVAMWCNQLLWLTAGKSQLAQLACSLTSVQVYRESSDVSPLWEVR